MIKKLNFAGRWYPIIRVLTRKKLELKPPLPKIVAIDPTPGICNLRCPLCPTGNNTINFEKKMIEYENFTKILDKVHSATSLQMFSWGESLLHPKICEMIGYASKKGLSIDIHSNFSLKLSEEFLEKLVKSGLTNLTLSIDGASQETYEKYRRNGNFSTVLENMEKISRIKKMLGSQKPNVIWKFVVNKYNEHEVEKARNMAESFGFDFRTSVFTLVDDVVDLPTQQYDKNRALELIDEWMPSEKYVYEPYKNLKDGKNSESLYGGHCTFLWDAIYVNPDGSVYPCCFATSPKSSFGNILTQPLEEIWNSSDYLYSRNLFTKEKFEGKVNNICTGCTNFKRVR